MIAVGGTFETLHIGHQYILTEASKISNIMAIGITTSKFVSKDKMYTVSDFKKRRKAIIEFLSKFTNTNNIIIEKLNDPFGPAISSKEIKVLLVTPDTYINAKKINKIRKSKGLKPLVLYVAGYIRNQWGYPISSTYIKLGYLDEWGRKIT